MYDTQVYLIWITFAEVNQVLDRQTHTYTQKTNISIDEVIAIMIRLLRKERVLRRVNGSNGCGSRYFQMKRSTGM